VEFSRRKNFVTHEMKPDDGRHFSRNTVAKMTAHRVAHHLVQFFDGIALRGDGVSKSGGDIAAVCFVFLNFKNDFAHGKTLFRPAISRKLEQF